MFVELNVWHYGVRSSSATSFRLVEVYYLIRRANISDQEADRQTIEKKSVLFQLKHARDEHCHPN